MGLFGSGKKNYPDRNVVRGVNKTHVWHKNSAGCTTKDGHRQFHKDTRIITNHYGKKVGRF